MPAMTVLGPVNADALGITLMHEHIIHNVGETTGNLDDRLDDEVLAVQELNGYARAGGRTLVDLTTIGIGPSPAALQRVAQATGLHIVMGTGYYIEDRIHPRIRNQDENALFMSMKCDLVEGFPGTGIRAGIIGEIGCGSLHGSEVTPFEKLVLRAAARAQQTTGASITVHTQIDFGPQGMWVLDILSDAGADLSRVILTHCDGRIDFPYFYDLMSRGSMVEFSAIGRIRHGSTLKDGTPVPDSEARVNAIAQLVAKGYASQLLLSHDVCSRTHLRKFGGGGFSYLLTHILPRLRSAGVSEAAIQTMIVHNPARLLDRPEP